MMRKLVFYIFCFLFFVVAIVAQESIDTLTLEKDTSKITEEKYWKTSGNLNLLLNQSSFQNWVAGGQNNLATNTNLKYNLNYKKEKTSWDTKIVIQYGLAKIQDNDLQKTDDRIEINTLAGKEFKKNWYASFFMNFITQMDVGIDPATNETTTQFFSPAFFQLGPGLLWKKNDNLKFNLAPITSRFIVANKKYTAVELPADAEIFNQNGGYFGVKANEQLRYELGTSFSGYYKFVLMKNVNLENTLNLYSNYLQETKNVDLDYTMNLAMEINKVLSTNLSLQMIYDDNAFEGLQIREVFGLGINVKL